MSTTTPKLIDEVRGLLERSVSDVFGTMANTIARPSPLLDFRGGEERIVAGSVGFIGDVSGLVYVYIKAPFARVLACRTLGFEEAQLEGDDLVNDVIGELTNMICGSVKSRLCDSGAACVLTIPSVVRGQYLCGGPVCASECRLLSFYCDTEPVLIELMIKPSK
jgi:chemotaxis protein CheX